jgi:hypothetical protein
MTQDGVVLSVELARALRDAGMQWKPARGDSFVMLDRGMDSDVFVLSDLTIEVHHSPTGPVIGFNGTTEWALDSIEQSEALWVPAEPQLRELLGDTFAGLAPTGRRLPGHAPGRRRDERVRRTRPHRGLRRGAAPPPDVAAHLRG